MEHIWYQDESMIWKNNAHTAMICVVIFAADFNVSDNWALNAKYHVPLVTKHAKN